MSKTFTRIIKNILFGTNLLFIGIVSACLFGIPMQYTMVILAIDSLLLIIATRKILVDLPSLFLLAGMYIHSQVYEDPALHPCVTLIPFLLYCVGKGLILLECDVKARVKARLLILAMAIGLFINSLLNAMEYYLWGSEGRRRWTEFWSQWNIPATQHVFWQLLIVGLTFYFFCYIKKYKISHSLLILGSVFSLWFSLTTGSRLLLMVFLVVLLINVLLFFYLNWNKDFIKKYLWVILSIIIIATIAIAIIWFTDLGGIRTYFQNSFWSRDGGILHNIRFQAQIDAIRQLFKYPSGGRQMILPSTLYFVHNVWLDMANASGIYSFSFIVIYTIFTFVDLFRLITNRRIDAEFKYLLMSAYFSFWLYYMVETALDAHLMLWAVWMLVCGIIQGVVIKFKRKIKSKKTKKSAS